MDTISCSGFPGLSVLEQNALYIYFGQAACLVGSLCVCLSVRPSVCLSVCLSVSLLSSQGSRQRLETPDGKGRRIRREQSACERERRGAWKRKKGAPRIESVTSGDKCKGKDAKEGAKVEKNQKSRLHYTIPWQKEKLPPPHVRKTSSPSSPEVSFIARKKNENLGEEGRGKPFLHQINNSSHHLHSGQFETFCTCPCPGQTRLHRNIERKKMGEAFQESSNRILLVLPEERSSSQVAELATS